MIFIFYHPPIGFSFSCGRVDPNLLFLLLPSLESSSLSQQTQPLATLAASRDNYVHGDASREQKNNLRLRLRVASSVAVTVVVTGECR